jgi:hypothetical protein
VTTLNIVAGYQLADRGTGAGDENVVNFGVALSYKLTESTSASLTYTRFDRFGGEEGVGDGGLRENALTLAIRKQF